MLSNVDLVIFHSPCFDGGAGAWVVKKWCHEHGLDSPVLFGCRPGMSEYKFPPLKDKSVVVVDICFSRQIMLDMRKECKELVVLDHHKTNQMEMVGLDFAVFDMGRSGCQLAWDYFFPNMVRPKFLDLIADRDLWKWDYPESKAFGAMMFHNFSNLSPEETVNVIDKVASMSGTELNDFIREGDMIFKFDQKQIDIACQHAVKCIFATPTGESYIVWTSNTRLYRSEVGAELAKRDDAQFALMYSYNLPTDEWWISLRSCSVEKANVGVIAKQFPDGGGHEKAAGFSLQTHIRPFLTPI